MKFQQLSPETLRRHKGVSFVGVSTVVFPHDGNGKIFLMKRSQKARDEYGNWTPIAGGLKHGQAAEANMRRELKEECGTEPMQTEFLGYADAFRSSPEGVPTHWVVLYFAAKVDPGLVKIAEPDMVDDWGWFGLDALPDPLHSQLDIFMDNLGDKLRQSMNG